MADKSDRTVAVATWPELCFKESPTITKSADHAQSSSRKLDSLPLEILLEIVSWLDWGSLLSLGRVCRRCRDVVSSHLGRLRVFYISWSELEGVVKTSANLTLLLAQMTSLRELYAWSSIDSKDVLEALVACSRRWPLLQKLELDLDEYPADLLERLCAGCESLTEVKLGEAVDDQVAEAVLTGRPDLLALDVCNYNSKSLRGEFLARLPAQLRRLAVGCRFMRSPVVRELARCGELRSLELEQVEWLRQEDLATGLAGCVQLERLLLRSRCESVSDCLPRTGLPALRSLQLVLCNLPDSDLQQLVLRLPNLQSVSLEFCDDSTQHGLAQIGKLPALTYLRLVDTQGVSDWALAHLRATQLTELQLGGGRATAAGVTARGLLRLSQSCPSLRKITLSYYDMVADSVKCGPGTDERRLLEWLRRKGLR